MGGFKVQKEKRKLIIKTCVHVLHKTLHLVFLQCCFAEEGKEMYESV